ncbi:hypothetical protein B7494_g181 [Chlorociboria aeruginascens]|nr:hypothetical protein B7494_g181 [Chlorociboria aeruginascens]
MFCCESNEAEGIFLSVTRYSSMSAILTLEHNYPKGNNSRAMVNVELLLSTLKSNETQIGEWVNVIGYIAAQQLSSLSEVRSEVAIQAIVLWSAGPLQLDGYERNLDQQKEDNSKEDIII